METVFYILMGIVFIGLLTFGFNKIFFAQETLSNQEKEAIRMDIENAFEKCLDPLNRGSVQYEKIKHESFNAICKLGTDINETDAYNTAIANGDIINYNLNVEESQILYRAEYNAILIEADYFKDGQMVNPQIIEQIKIDNDFPITECYYQDQSKGTIELEIKC